MKKLMKEDKAAAQSWGQKEKFAAIGEEENRFCSAVESTRVDQWQVNVAVHYNEWANLHRNDFGPVVTAYKGLTEAFKCKECHSLLFVTPEHGQAEALRCSCGIYNVNLKIK